MCHTLHVLSMSSPRSTVCTTTYYHILQPPACLRLAPTGMPHRSRAACSGGCAEGSRLPPGSTPRRSDQRPGSLVWHMALDPRLGATSALIRKEYAACQRRLRLILGGPGFRAGCPAPAGGSEDEAAAAPCPSRAHFGDRAHGNSACGLWGLSSRNPKTLNPEP